MDPPGEPQSHIRARDEPLDVRWPPLTYWAKATVVVAATVGVLAVMLSISSILILLLISLVIAVGLEPAIRFFITRVRIPNRGLAVLVIFLLGAALVSLFLALVVPALVREVQSLSQEIPHLIPRLRQRNDFIGRFIADHQDQIQGFLSTLPSRIGGSFDTILSVTGKIGGIVFDVLTVTVLSIFFMLYLPGMRSGAVQSFKPVYRPRVRRLIDTSVTKIGGYVAGNLATSGICALTTSVVLTVLGLPFSIALGIWAGIADLIPAVGSYLGMIPALAVGFSQGLPEGLGVLAFFIIYQQVENYLIVPRVMQNAVDMSSVAVLISTLIGASLAGFAGALLAIPVAATIKVVVSDVLSEYHSEEEVSTISS